MTMVAPSAPFAGRIKGFVLIFLALAGMQGL